MPTPLIALVRGPGASAGAAPVLSTINVDLFDTANGNTLTLAGLNLTGVAIVEVSDGVGGWTTCSFSGNTATSVRFVTPARAAGTYLVRVWTAGGTSNTLVIEAWTPTTDTSCTIIYDSKHTPYNALAGTWTPRYHVMSGTYDASMEPPSFSAGNHPSVGGAPSFDGNGAVQAGLKCPDNAWTINYTGANTGGYVAGTVFAIFDFTNSQAMEPTDATGTVYDDPSVLSTGLSTFGLCAGLRTGDNVPIIRGYIYDGASGNYRGPTVATTQGATHSAVVRWGLGGTCDLSIDGATSGGSYNSRAILNGLDAAYLAHVFRAGLTYPVNSISDQLFAGTLRAWGVLNAKASDTFVTKLNKWRQAQGWT